MGLVGLGWFNVGALEVIAGMRWLGLPSPEYLRRRPITQLHLAGLDALLVQESRRRPLLKS